MKELAIETMTSAIMFANQSDPRGDGTISDLTAFFPGMNHRRFAVAIVEALDRAGFEIVRKRTD